MSKVNVLIIGAGGREHALGWKLSQSPRCGRLAFAPGNAGTARLGDNLSLKIEPVTTKVADDLAYYCRHHDIGLVVIGPEDPLAQGLTDRLQKLGLKVFGPTQAAARLEADKAFAKDVMRSVAVPTAESRTFRNPQAALEYVKHHETPLVVKAAGLAKGKGVIVCDGPRDAAEAVKHIMIDRAFGDAGDCLVIEERLTGQEVSVLALVDGRHVWPLEAAQDHKQAHEGDRGPNTGGMGAYSPTPLLTDKLMRDIERQVFVPMLDALRREDVEYRGILYAGLMLTPGGPKVLEFNCRFGDPECQTLLMRMQADLLEVLFATCEGRLDQVEIAWDPRPCCCVVLASPGYPGDYTKGHPITGIDEAQATAPGLVRVFHAGTALDKTGAAVTAGGRVLNVCAIGDDLRQAQRLANAAADRIRFEGAWFRRDIGFRVMK
jgi:phosphoribosylamine--glycine ligase